MRLKAFVQQENTDEVKWLIIESYKQDTKGYFLYYFLSEVNAYDTWHKSIDDAFEAAQLQYGIQKEDWDILKDD